MHTSWELFGSETLLVKLLHLNEQRTLYKIEFISWDLDAAANAKAFANIPWPENAKSGQSFPCKYRTPIMRTQVWAIIICKGMMQWVWPTFPCICDIDWNFDEIFIKSAQ